MRRVHGVGAAGLVIAVVSVAMGGSGTAAGASQICEQFGWTTIEGSYVVQNNRWGSSTASQCINVTDTGFVITTQRGSNPAGGNPVGYPSVFLGCFNGNCSPGSSLPMQLSQIRSATSSISYSYVNGGDYDAAYDIWLDPAPRKAGDNRMEMMIWFNRQGSATPAGSPVGHATIGGRDWEVWHDANAGEHVISYVAPSPINAWDFSVLDFFNDVAGRGLITDAWYLTSIQAGFEPFDDGVGLAVNSFSAAVN